MVQEQALGQPVTGKLCSHLKDFYQPATTSHLGNCSWSQMWCPPKRFQLSKMYSWLQRKWRTLRNSVCHPELSKTGLGMNAAFCCCRCSPSTICTCRNFSQIFLLMFCYSHTLHQLEISVNKLCIKIISFQTSKYILYCSWIHTQHWPTLVSTSSKLIYFKSVSVSPL